MNEKVEKARNVYLRIAQEFIKYAMNMDDDLAEEVESGLAASFWHEELKHEFYEAFH